MEMIRNKHITAIWLCYGALKSNIVRRVQPVVKSVQKRQSQFIEDTVYIVWFTPNKYIL